MNKKLKELKKFKNAVANLSVLAIRQEEAPEANDLNATLIKKASKKYRKKLNALGKKLLKRDLTTDEVEFIDSSTIDSITDSAEETA